MSLRSFTDVWIFCIRFLSLLAQTDVLIRRIGVAWSLGMVRLALEDIVSELLFTAG